MAILEELKESPEQQEISDFLDDLVEQEKERCAKKGDKSTDDIIFTTNIFLYLLDKGYDIERFAYELVHLSEKMGPKKELTTEDVSVEQFEQMMEDALDEIYPEQGDGKSEEPVHWVDKEMVRLFCEEFERELQCNNARKWMFVMDTAIHVGESPKQLRAITDEHGIEAIFNVRMYIHQLSKEAGVSYQEAGKMAGDMAFDSK